MAMILDAFVSKFIDLLVELAKEEVDMLLGVPGEIKKLQNKLRMISKVLADAERRRINDGAIDDWVKQLKDVMYDADDILDLCQIEANKCSEGSSSTSSSVRFSFPFLSWIRKPPVAHEIGTQIRELNLKLEEISRWRSEFNLELTSPDQQQVTSQISRKTSPVVEIDTVGSRIQEDTQNLVDLLIKDDSRRNILVYAIVGAGGIGKTTLAKKIYNDQRIQEEFSEKRWVCVSQEFDEINLLKDITGDAKDQSRSLLEPRLQKNLRDKKLFLVLDDVWTAKVWCDLLRNTLYSCAAGSRILVTTRNEQIAMQMMAVNTHHMDKLSLDDSWSLLCKKVVLTGEEGEIQHLKDIGMEFVKKCDGLPLAIKAVAGVLCMKEKTRRAWNRVLESTAWSTAGLPEEVMGALYLSYEDLPSYLKQCFVYCSLFPEDYVIDMDYITQLWIAEGFVKAEGSSTMEDTAKEYYRELIMRNLLQPYLSSRRVCQMHDLLHCLARYMARDESSIVRKVHEVGSSNGLMKLHRVFLRDSETREIPDVFVKHDSLRTLMWQWSLTPMAQTDVVFNKLSRLRVLDMSHSKIQRLPDSLGNLIHLRESQKSTEAGYIRYQDKRDAGKHRESPKSMVLGNAGMSAPFSPSQQYREFTRSLDLYRTEMVGMPVGLGRLQNLHTLRGFTLQRNRSEGWCTIEELRSLSCLTDLSIGRLERISSSSEARAAQLRNKPKLRSLRLSCTQVLQPSEEEMRRIEEVFEELHPPPSLEELNIWEYFGCEFPKWMAETSSTASILFANLRWLVLEGCRHCERLPPCGLLPNLEYLSIGDSAASVTVVGPEFSVDTRSTSSGGGREGVDTSKYAFPRLENLEFNDMDNWQEWHWDKGTQAMPCLKDLTLSNCPKLMSLPEGLLLHATSLTTLMIEHADSLTTIENLRSLKELYIKYSPNVEKVSDLPALATLYVEKCPNLKVVENLQSLIMMTLEGYDMKSLPSYLLKRVQRDTKKRKRVQVAHLEKLEIQCGSELIRKICQRASPEWPTIQDIQQVHVYSKDRSMHVLYNKSPFSFTTKNGPNYVSYDNSPFSFTTNLNTTTTTSSFE
ncbi:putative disease resistance protein RGA3 [Cocos nucifera]|uniref:Putative disease resistance protein RGA3 n=1 Tax=Cocos nucifera TaxID=13894 RepID=A0A8K0IDZ3_COCNU|nr:putative disease resistance protein RGA3 [Cocos nucifera]